MLTKNSLSKLLQSGVLAMVGLGLALPVLAQENEPVDFVKTIKPIFDAHCVSCHGEKDPESFRIDVKDEAMDYITAKSPDESDLYLALVSDDEEVLMPPPDEDNPLTKEQIQSVKSWIEQGAQWPVEVNVVTDATPPAPVVAAAAAPALDEKKADDQGVNPPAIDPKTQRLFNATGSLHPAAVHLPIGLLLAAGLFALFSLRGNFVMGDCAYYCLWLGTLGAIVACVTGYWFSPMENKGTIKVLADLWDQSHPVFWHRTSAIVATAFALLLALFAASARNRDPDDGILWKFGLIVLALGIGWVGHEGGELTHGKQHYKDIKAIGADLFPGIFGDAPVDPPAAPAEQAPVPDENPVDDVGKTSDET